MLEDRLGRAEAVAEVVHRRAADVAALQDDDRLVDRRALPHVLVEQRHHLVFALGEVVLGVVAALLEHDDVAPGLGELLGDHRAAGAGADDADLGRQLRGRRRRSSNRRWSIDSRARRAAAAAPTGRRSGSPARSRPARSSRAWTGSSAPGRPGAASGSGCPPSRRGRRPAPRRRGAVKRASLRSNRRRPHSNSHSAQQQLPATLGGSWRSARRWSRRPRVAKRGIGRLAGVDHALGELRRGSRLGGPVSTRDPAGCGVAGAPRRDTPPAAGEATPRAARAAAPAPRRNAARVTARQRVRSAACGPAKSASAGIRQATLRALSVAASAR